MTLTEDLTGRQLGKYELRDRIGRGGMAEVYKAYHASLDRYVAVKVLHPFLSEDQDFKARFEREAQNIARLKHHNIVQVYDFDTEPGVDLYYMVMEYVDGQTLRNMLLQAETDGKLLPAKEVVRIARDLASALAYAHGQDMIHRDIKPANVMLDENGRVVLTDFGIAKIVSGQQLTSSGTMIGTPAYMAPEQGLGQSGDRRSDIYSLGVVMFQMAAGAPPYEADTPIALVLKHVNDPLPSLSTFNPDLPQGLERIIYKSLAKAPEERFQTAQEMVDLLDDPDTAAKLDLPEQTAEFTVVRSVPQAVGEEPTLGEVPIVGRIANNYLGAAFGVALVVIAAIVGFAIFLNLRTEQTPTNAEPSAGQPVATDEVAEVFEPAATAPRLEGADVEATALVATVEYAREQRATQNAIATNPALGTAMPPSPAPDCTYGHEVTAQFPEEYAPVLESSSVTKRVVIENTGNCAWEAGTTFRFLDGMQLGAPQSIDLDKVVRPGDSVTLAVDFTLPPLSVDRDVQSTWQLTTATGARIGRLFTFDFEIVPPTATPTATPTAAPPPEATSDP